MRVEKVLWDFFDTLMNENVVKLLKSAMWDLATCSDGEPNVVPVAFKDVTEDGKLTAGGFLD